MMVFAHYESMGVLKDINEGFAPPERLTTSEWAVKYFQLPPTSAEPGNWYPDGSLSTTEGNYGRTF